MAIIAYHVRDPFDNGSQSSVRSGYYLVPAFPRIIFDGTSEMEGGSPTGSDYNQLAPLYDRAAAVAPELDISLSLESADRVRVEITNTSAHLLTGALHLALVERHRPYSWGDMNAVDFVCRAMLPSAVGQAMTLAPWTSAASTQQVKLDPNWNYCSIVAFFQARDRRILQGAAIALENTVPAIQFNGKPATGALWLRGSTQTIAWSSSRPLESVRLEYSEDGGENWRVIQAGKKGTDEFRWTAPETNSVQCLVAVRDPYGGAQAVAGPFAIGYKGDLNADGVVNEADRKVLIGYLLENKAALVPGTDLNEDGVTDILDLIYFDERLRRVP